MPVTSETATSETAISKTEISAEQLSGIWRAPGRRIALGLVVAAFAWLFLLPAGIARAEVCERPGPPVVSVRTLTKPASVDLTRGVAQLTGNPNLVAPRHLPEFRYTLGSTEIVPERDSRVEFGFRPMSVGGVCWWVTRVQVTVTVHTRVYIAKEIPKGSCIWNHVTQHETKHVKMDKLQFPKLADHVRPGLTRAIATARTARDQAAIEKEGGDLVGAAITAAIAAFLDKRNQAQLTIDTREEYSRVNNLCGDAAISAILAQAGVK